MNIDATAVTRTKPGETEKRGNMTNRNLLLGRSKPKGGGPQRMVRRDLLKFRWSFECPGCGFKVTGDGQPQPGQRLARCGRCKMVLVLGGG